MAPGQVAPLSPEPGSDTGGEEVAEAATCLPRCPRPPRLPRDRLACDSGCGGRGAKVAAARPRVATGTRLTTERLSFRRAMRLPWTWPPRPRLAVIHWSAYCSGRRKHARVCCKRYGWPVLGVRRQQPQRRRVRHSRLWAPSWHLQRQGAPQLFTGLRSSTCPRTRPPPVGPYLSCVRGKGTLPGRAQRPQRLPVRRKAHVRACG